MKSLEHIYSQLQMMQKRLSSLLPLKTDFEKSVRDYFDTLYTYESNKIEGNTLTHQETRFVIHENMIVENKTLLEHLEVRNHFHALQYIREAVKNKEDLSLSVIKKIHLIILSGINNEWAGKWRDKPVFIKGSDYTFPSDSMIDGLMFGLEHFYRTNKGSMNPVELASHVHEKFVSIHPFIDGNGRTGRLLMNFILLQNGYPLAIISGDAKERKKYYDCLESARGEDNNSEFQYFIASKVKEALEKALEAHGKGEGNV